MLKNIIIIGIWITMASGLKLDEANNESVDPEPEVNITKLAERLDILEEIIQENEKEVNNNNLWTHDTNLSCVVYNNDTIYKFKALKGVEYKFDYPSLCYYEAKFEFEYFGILNWNTCVGVRNISLLQNAPGKCATHHYKDRIKG